MYMYVYIGHGSQCSCTCRVRKSRCGLIICCPPEIHLLPRDSSLRKRQTLHLGAWGCCRRDAALSSAEQTAVGMLRRFALAVICNLQFAALAKYSHLRADKPVSKSDCGLLIPLPWRIKCVLRVPTHALLFQE